MSEALTPAANAPRARPPVWLVVATGALAVTCLVLAVAETDLRAHYLIDGGQSLSLCGLGFILLAGLYLFRRRRLFVSLPLVFPWLLYPVITQGDQIIDNLSINEMRVICQVLLAALFGTPVAVIVLAARHALAARFALTRQGAGLLAAMLLLVEVWIAHRFVGALMVMTLALMILATLLFAWFGPSRTFLTGISAKGGSERIAFVMLFAGVAASLGLYLGFKNRPGVYQGSPSAFMDPKQQVKGYPLDRVAVPMRAPARPAAPEAIQHALTLYAHTLERLLAGYHILDRNYTYDFHNRLFLRHRPLLPNYRAAGLQQIKEARRLRDEADAQCPAARASLAPDDPLAALLDDVRGYVAFNFDRAPALESLSADFERTPAGLQHAAHLYEGECKALGTGLAAILRKHRVVLDSPATASVTSEFAAISRAVNEAYAHHVVGF